MSDKVLELVEKMYNEFSIRFSSMDQRFDAIDQRFDAMDKRVEGLEKEVRNCRTDITTLQNSFIRMEFNINNKIDILFDAQAATNQRLDRVEAKLDDLSAKVEKHDIKIQVIEGGKGKSKRKI